MSKGCREGLRRPFSIFEKRIRPMKTYEYMAVDLSAEPSFNVHVKLEKSERLRQTGLAADLRDGRLEVFDL